MRKKEKDRTIKQVLDAFDDYCKPKKNEIVVRYRLNMRKQDQSEMIETFITDVKTQAEKNLTKVSSLTHSCVIALFVESLTRFLGNDYSEHTILILIDVLTCVELQKWLNKE